MIPARPAFALAATLVLILLLYFLADNKPPARTVYDDMADEILDSLPESQTGEITRLRQAFRKEKQEEEKATLALELARAWEALGNRHISAEYYRQQAELLNEPAAWKRAGDRFYQLSYLTEDEQLRVNAVFRGIYAYEQALEADPSDSDTRVKLASLYTDGTSDVMKGILMLREIAEEDPGNLEAQFRLGRFSLISGQYQKAIERFETVLQKDSLNLQARYFLAEGYLGLNQKDQAIETLETGIAIFEDPSLKEELRNNINKLKE